MKKLSLLLLAGAVAIFRAAAESDEHDSVKGLGEVRRWNQISIDASGLDHTPTGLGEPHIFGEQVGPCRAARAIAIVHIAMFDTANSIERKYESYTGLRGPEGDLSMKAAISQAAHDTLVVLFPSQAYRFDNFLAEDLGEVHKGAAKRRGILLGQRAATKILQLRANDGSEVGEIRVGTNANEYATSDLPGHWRKDPISQLGVALGAHWYACRPFVVKSNAQFRAPAPPALNSMAYAQAFLEAKRLGGDGVHTGTERTPEQTEIGIYWAYDGTPSLCAPPRLYNQITLKIADQKKTGGLELARLLTLVNVAMADAGMGIWDSKYYYDYWRPVTGIREANTDGNSDTTADASFSPLGAPASNLSGPNFTPPFPAYPSGHAGFGGALFQTLRRFYKTDHIKFTFQSDEFNGVTKGDDGNVRPVMTRTFQTLSQAEEENGQSRIYLGIHWSFDKTEGIELGNKVGDYVFEHAFRRRHD